MATWRGLQKNNMNIILNLEKMICPYCNKEAPWVENKEKYGKNYGKSYMCYFCKPCDSYVGCHANTTKSLGTMANKELRQWRMKAHEAFDPIWKKKKLNNHTVFNNRKRRFKAYQWLSRELGLVAAHIGESNIDICKKIIELSNNRLNASKE